MAEHNKVTPSQILELPVGTTFYSLYGNCVFKVTIPERLLFEISNHVTFIETQIGSFLRGTYCIVKQPLQGQAQVYHLVEFEEVFQESFYTLEGLQVFATLEQCPQPDSYVLR